MPALFLLKFLGFGKKYWKYILIAMAVIALVLLVRHKIEAFKEEHFNRGVLSEQNRMKEVIRKENEQNRKLETQIKSGLDSLAARLEEQRERDREREAELYGQITDKLGKNPAWRSQACSVSTDIVKDRNSIRALGPGGNK